MRVGARVQAYRACLGADGRHAYRVKTATLPRAENEYVGKLSGGDTSLCPSEAGKQTPLINEREREEGARSSPQFLRQSLKKQWLGCLQEEMIAGKHPDREGNGGLIAPCLEIFMIDSLIAQTAKSGNRAIQRRPR